MELRQAQEQNILEKYTRNLTDLAEKGRLDPVIGRNQEIRRLIQILSRRTKNNPVLIGHPGVGKTAIAEGLAVRIVNKDVPNVFLDKKILSLDVSALVAGAKYRGEFEERVKALIKEVINSNGQIILFIDEMHTLVGAGGLEGSMDAGQILKPPLARGDLRVIGATTTDEYRKFIEKDKALERRFQSILVKEPSVEDSLTILRGLKEKYELHHGVRIQDSAIQAAVKLSSRYITYRFLPDKAIDLIDEAASRLNIEMHSMPEELDQNKRELMHLSVEQKALEKEKSGSNKERLKEIKKQMETLKQDIESVEKKWQKEKDQVLKLRGLKKQIESVNLDIEKSQRLGDLDTMAKLQYGRLPELQKQLKDLEKLFTKKDSQLIKEEVGEEEIAEIVALWTKIPVNKILKSESQKFLEMEKHLKKRVVGQDKALELVSNSLRRARAEISDPCRPIGSFLFLGKTGVGKTETVKALAEFLFDKKEALFRIDMSEYMEKHSVSRLIGAPPGYVGYEEGGQLTEKIRREPYSVILLDEIEKAHKDVFNVLLQILDDGRLTDGQGRSVDFRNSILIMTSNIGADILNDDSVKKKEQAISRELKNYFRPEFINRLDEIVIFENLNKDDLSKIAKIQIEDLKQRLKYKQIDISLDKSAIDFLVQRGFDKDFGARPLKRVIQKELLDPIAKKIISAEIQPRDKIQVLAHDLSLEIKT